MKLNYLKVFNFGLFKNAEFNPDQINSVKGVNLDNPKQSGNASGKSSLFKLAIIFLLYGESCGKKLERLMRFGTKKTTVEGEIDHEGKLYKIKRTIPNSLELYIDGIKQDYNTATICQTSINNLFGDYEYFRKYCLIDDKGINILDYLKDLRSITTLKKELMQFIDNQFTPIRESLLIQKNNCEQYTIDKRPYTYYLSTKRLNTLQSGLQNLEQILVTTDTDKSKQQEIINDINVKQSKIEDKIVDLDKERDNNMETEILNTEKQQQYKDQILALNAHIYDNPEQIDYNSEIKIIERNITENEEILKSEKNQQESKIFELLQVTNELSAITTNIKNTKETVKKLQSENTGVTYAQSGTRCKHCGSQITEENKNGFIKENNEEIKIKEKELSEYNLLLDTVTNKKIKLESLISNSKLSLNEIEQKISNLRINKNNLDTKQIEYIELIKSIENKKIQRDSEIKRLNSLIEELENQNLSIDKKQFTIEEQIETLKKELPILQEQYKQENDCLNYYKSLYESTQYHIGKLKERIIKLTEAFKFLEYKYNESDIQLYTDSIKTLDQFSGYYIQEWLNNLTIIINDLLKNVNQSIELTDSKEFIKMKDNGQELYYSDLSSGQQIFLSAVFKLAILLQKGESNKIIIADDGMGTLDEINFKNFIEICKNIPMQFFLVFQDVPDIEGINYIKIERKNNESKII